MNQGFEKGSTNEADAPMLVAQPFPLNVKYSSETVGGRSKE